MIYIQSSRPVPNLDLELPFIDKALHFTAWFLLSLLFFRAYRGHALFLDRPNLLIWVSFLSAVLYGVSDEIHQHFVPLRSADIIDLAADAAGSFCGAFASAWLYAFFSKSAVPDIQSTAESPDRIRQIH